MELSALCQTLVWLNDRERETYWWRVRSQTKLLDYLSIHDRTTLGVGKVKTKSVNDRERNVTVRDAVHAQKGTVTETGATGMATFELAFSSFLRRPWVLGRVIWTCVGR
jgi:hypothetical protein